MAESSPPSRGCTRGADGEGQLQLWATKSPFSHQLCLFCLHSALLLLFPSASKQSHAPIPTKRPLLRAPSIAAGEVSWKHTQQISREMVAELNTP